MEIQAIQKYIHTAPRKLRLVADMIRKLSPEKALETLRFTNKSAAGDLIKAIKTVVANAKTKGMENINFKSVEVNEGSRMKRFRAGAKGRARPYKRRMSHIKIVLTDDLSDKVQVTRNKKEDKKEKK
ncbi:TPA: 50S ribosomal protein L22 [Candidatus Daviesbacteria bacterium]|uniref:Large ribosomal subunit protein uL22 n=1 Tax=Candidatus Daviesbacteria bacterium GW2011_GWF2_38_6 TaxID=1618432 RepID=A0A0G0KDA6_9BACT|nr:MAG: 50S ribosomal protein L22 [Candidatus Daviesbacteria bacterium GW2011_GWA2_38_17]KKQ76837.1 MAG: 50S ribosomal protein L22 [Candidatus Daviesbacteria bacterium GW2011_GWF2_38_6]OGE27157.1 MAG: 50S ribosomal protein L22 [Candidatus Daviesbacteria bacterium RIFCSPHIGHO2_02_FULL_39_41]OGE29308.1 MAG: 50S ribosomal protein L22 [Candidatus Daviesbacteria bacterium RIFCSPHIGHO2_01_FULL_38_8b]OGE45209.1 MAG: 50S ribosomal protein L22 [Candidatus Daviesbacteria bacterium RIFCSPHIGHO2_12_FULL_38